MASFDWFATLGPTAARFENNSVPVQRVISPSLLRPINNDHRGEVPTIPLRFWPRLEWTVLERIFQRSRRDIISQRERERERERETPTLTCQTTNSSPQRETFGPLNRSRIGHYLVAALRREGNAAGSCARTLVGNERGR